MSKKLKKYKDSELLDYDDFTIRRLSKIKSRKDRGRMADLLHSEKLAKQELFKLARVKARSLAEKLTPVYRVLDWKWAAFDGKCPAYARVPTTDEIEAHILYMIGRVEEDFFANPTLPSYSIETGGLRVEYSGSVIEVLFKMHHLVYLGVDEENK